jgi:hypothetical protein
MPKNNNIIDSIVFILYILAPFYFLYMIYKYGFTGYINKRVQRQQNRYNYINNIIDSF